MFELWYLYLSLVLQLLNFITNHFETGRESIQVACFLVLTQSNFFVSFTYANQNVILCQFQLKCLSPKVDSIVSTHYHLKKLRLSRIKHSYFTWILARITCVQIRRKKCNTHRFTKMHETLNCSDHECVCLCKFGTHWLQWRMNCERLLWERKICQ